VEILICEVCGKKYGGGYGDPDHLQRAHGDDEDYDMEP